MATNQAGAQPKPSTGRNVQRQPPVSFFFFGASISSFLHLVLQNPPNSSAPIPSRLPALADWRQPGPIRAVRRRLGFGLGGGGRRGTGLVDASPPRVTAAPGLEISSAWIKGAAAAAAAAEEEEVVEAAVTVAAPIS